VHRTDSLIDEEPEFDPPPAPGSVVYWPISAEADLIVGALRRGEPGGDLWRVDGRSGSLDHESFAMLGPGRARVLA